MPRQFGLAPVAAPDHALLGDHLLGDAPFGEQRMALTAVQPVLFAVQRLVEQAIHPGGKGADGQIQAIVQHSQLQLVGTHHRQMQVHRRVFLAVGTDHLGQRQGRIAYGRIQHAEVESAAQFALERGGVALETFQFAEQTQGFLVEQFALAGQAEAAAPAMAEAQAELAFQLAHIGTDRRGRQVEFLLRRGKTLLTHHADEDAQQFQVRQSVVHGFLVGYCRNRWCAQCRPGPFSLEIPELSFCL
ncbi:hypothetical protein D3C85_1214460 [compost metagenome]